MRVYYEDTDFGGVVYYANYLRFFERARTEWLRGLGVDHQSLAREQGLQFVVRRAEIDFLRGARLDDQLEITVADCAAQAQLPHAEAAGAAGRRTDGRRAGPSGVRTLQGLQARAAPGRARRAARRLAR